MTMSPGVGVPEIEPCDTAASLQPDTPENFDCGITSRRWPLWPPHDGKSTKSARKDGGKKHSLKYLLGLICIRSNDWMCACQLTCTRVCAIDQWLGGVSKDDRSHAVEAVFFSVNLQARLLWAHHVVRGVSSVHNQLWDTKLLLQHWEGRTITYRGDKHQQKSVACLCAALWFNSLFNYVRSGHYHRRHRKENVSALPMAGWSSAESRQSLWCGTCHGCPSAAPGQCSHRYIRRWRWRPWSVLKSSGEGCFGWLDWVALLYPKRQNSELSET